MVDDKQDAGAAWPPRPQRRDGRAGRWAPAAGEAAIRAAPFKCLHMRAGGSVSDFRVGEVSVFSGGMTLSGTRALRAELQFWILFPLFLAFAVVGQPAIWFLIAIGLECIRVKSFLALAWDEIDEVHLSPHYPILCVLYHSVDKGRRVRRISFTPRLSRPDYDALAASIYDKAPASVVIHPQGRLTLLCGSAALYAFLAGAASTTAVWGGVHIAEMVSNLGK